MSRITPRALGFALTRARVWVVSAVGAALLAQQVVALGIFCLAIGVVQALKVLSYPDLEERLQLKAEKQRHGITRMLNAPERQEILAIHRHLEGLRADGCDAGLLSRARSHAWELVVEAGAHDATAALRAWRHALPHPAQIGGGSGAAGAGQDDILRALRQEVALRRAAHREVAAAARA